MHTPNAAVPPAAPTLTLTTTSDPTADTTVAFTRTVCSPPSSATADNAASPASASCNDKTTLLSLIGRSTEVTVTADPPTDAEPDNVNFSPDSATLSPATVRSNVPDPDVPPAGIETVTALPVKLVQASSPAVGHEDARVAPPAPATATVTSVAVVRTDDEPLKLAVTVISSALAPSSTDDGDTAKSISASSSRIVSVDSRASPNADDPSTAKVSGPSTIASSVIDNPANVAVPEGVMLAAGKTIVFGVEGAYEKSAAVAFPAPAGVSAAADNVTVVAEESTDDAAFQKLADTDTPEPDAPSATVS